MTKPIAALISLGCAKNLVDSEIMVPQLEKLGYAVTNELDRATLIVVNTCGFLESSVQEAVDTILEVAQLKSAGRCDTLVVAGCMVQRYGRKLPGLLPEVDLFLGTSQYHELARIIQEHGQNRPVREGPNRVHLSRPSYLPSARMDRKRSTPFYYAYLKLADGCSNRCTYCMIPSLRGPYRSRTVDDVVEEAEEMVSEGVREINLIAQDLTAFGVDLKGSSQLPKLIRILDEIPRLEWIRLLYAYPDRVDELLLEAMTQCGKVVPYLDIPFQHCSARILRAMGRGPDVEDPRHTVARIRSHIPGVALRTSLMVGFPGESQEEFEELLSFLSEVRLDHVGAFAFSPEKGTRAAAMSGQVADEVKADRLERLMECQREISRQRLLERVGETLEVLVEGYHEETDLLLTGRASIQAPEVDGTVLITSGQADVGQMCTARVTGAHDYDLEVELEPAR